MFLLIITINMMMEITMVMIVKVTIILTMAVTIFYHLLTSNIHEYYWNIYVILNATLNKIKTFNIIIMVWHSWHKDQRAWHFKIRAKAVSCSRSRTFMKSYLAKGKKSPANSASRIFCSPAKREWQKRNGFCRWLFGPTARISSVFKHLNN